MRKLIFLTLLLLIIMMNENSRAQSLPFNEIPAAPDSYTTGNVLGRMVDGLGFRYYWATEGLVAADLDYKASEEGRTLKETLVHIYSLSLTIHNTLNGKPNIRPEDWSSLDLQTTRKKTLENLQDASQMAKTTGEKELEHRMIIFKRGEDEFTFPFWNLINGPLADAIWHTGQVVLLRRAAGNPMNSKVNVFTGKVDE